MHNGPTFPLFLPLNTVKFLFLFLMYILGSLSHSHTAAKIFYPIKNEAPRGKPCKIRTEKPPGPAGTQNSNLAVTQPC